MSNVSQSESRRMYSWWWDSHNTPKNSKWLQENLTDIDGKVKSMIKLIEEDADSFARRAEMYYKKRPELMKLVEDFYRAYRALAERYNHATGELRHAQKTIAKAFPDEVHFEPSDDDVGPHTPEMKLPPCSLFDGVGISSSDGCPGKKGLMQFSGMFGSEKMGDRIQNPEESPGNAEIEVECLKKALSDMKAEKENVFAQYQKCLEKLSEIETELNNAHKDSVGLGERAGLAEIEVQTLKEALIQFEVEKIAEMIKQNDYLERISSLEALASRFQEDVKGLDGRASEAESRARNLQDEISKLELEKEMGVRQYMQSLEKISDLEKIISSNEVEAKSLKKQAQIAEIDVFELKRAFAVLNKEKEDIALEYKGCLEKISELEKELSIAKKEVDQLNNEVSTGNEKLENALKKCTFVEESNRSLRDQADNLAIKILTKDQELVKKQEELEKFQNCLLEENSRRERLEKALESLQNLHSRSLDDRRALELEMNNVVRMLKEMEISKIGLEEEIRCMRDENQAKENMQSEIVGLRDIKKKLEAEVMHQAYVTVSLQKEISCLKEEIEGLNESYRGLIGQVEAAGLNPKCVEISIKSLHDENLKLRQKYEQESIEKAILSRKLEEIEEVLKKMAVSESSLSDLNVELAVSRGEKASILSQLQAMTENMRDLLGKNAVLEDSLSTAKVELQGLREKSKGLKEICDLLKNERSFLLSERRALVSKLENVEKSLNSLEKQFLGLEIKCADLEKEKEVMHSQVEKLKVSLCGEKQERECSKLESETRVAELENQIHLLHEEKKWKKQESEEELDKSLKAQFEISILHKFIKDMEEKNCSLIIECQKHVEASKLAEKVISELESESLEQHGEAELLLDEIERLRLGIYQIFRALESGSDFENEENSLNHILGSIEDLKGHVLKNEDENQQLLVENSVLLALLEEIESKGMEIESKKLDLERESKVMAEKLVSVEKEKSELLELNGKLKSDANKGHLEAEFLEAELDSLCVEQRDLRKAYNLLQEIYAQVNEENTYLFKEFSELKEEKYKADQKNDAVLLELLATENQSTVLKSFGREKVGELQSILEKLSRQHDISKCLEKEMNALCEKMDSHKVENLVLKDVIRRLEKELHEAIECNVQMNKEIIDSKESFTIMEAKLKATEKLNSDLRGALSELKTESSKARENLEKDLSKLSENNSAQEKEIRCLSMVNKTLESELSILRLEMEENATREHNLSTELQEMNNEFELWEAEASSFCFDLQVSSVHEVLLRNKVEELSGVCKSLEINHEGKVLEIEEMKGKVCLMENHISGLRSQLDAYGPVIASLSNDIEILEGNALQHGKAEEANDQETELWEVYDHPTEEDTSQILPEDESLLALRSLQMRVKAVGKLIRENNEPISLRRSNSGKAQEFSMVEIDPLKPRHSFSRRKGYAKNELNCSPKLQRLKSKSTYIRNGALMKDIPLDNNSSRKKGKVGSDDIMLELWETTEDESKVSFQMTNLPSTDSDVEREMAVDKLELSARRTELSDAKILEKLSSDAEKLEFLQTALRNLRSKSGAEKKVRKGKDVNSKAVREQLQEAEDAAVHLVDLNGQLVNNILDCPKDEMEDTARAWRVKVMEQAEKGSERIERLHLGVQKIQYLLLKMEDEKRSKFLGGRTVVLRDFIGNNGRKSSSRRKKAPRCACFKQSTSRNDIIF